MSLDDQVVPEMKLLVAVFACVAAVIFTVDLLWDSEKKIENSSREELVRGLGREAVGSEAFSSLLSRAKDENLPLEKRLSAIEDILDSSDKESVRLVFELFREDAVEGDQGNRYIVLTELIDRLSLNGEEGEPSANALAELITDNSVDIVFRDVAVSHATEWLSFDSNENGRATPESKTALMTSMVAVLEDTSNLQEPIVATILTSIADLRDSLPKGSVGKYIDLARRRIFEIIVGNVKASDSNRVAAIDAAARMGMSNLRPVFRDLAADPGEDPSIRLTAITALGGIGNSEDRKTIEQIAMADGEMAPAARSALRRIKLGQRTTDNTGEVF